MRRHREAKQRENLSESEEKIFEKNVDI